MFINNLSLSFSNVFVAKKEDIQELSDQKENSIEEFTPISVVDEPENFEDV